MQSNKALFQQAYEQENVEFSSYKPEHITPVCSIVFEQNSPILSMATISINSLTAASLFHHAALVHQCSIQTKGFIQGKIPLEYIKKNYKEHLINHIEEFLFKFYVVDFLYDQLRAKQLLIIHEPELISVFEKNQQINYLFEVNLFPDLQVVEWKHFPFKAPKRKNYKDLDHQVLSFLKEERELLESTLDTHIAIGDWVCFGLIPCDENQLPFDAHQQQKFWFKIGNEETESLLKTIFIGKKIGDLFATNNKGLQTYLSDQLDTDYFFLVEILDIVPYRYFCVEQFKRHFKLKTQKEVHQKLIEVFSYRNDISQRRETVEECFKLMLAKHRFTVPPYLIARQQKLIIEKVQEIPDYNVYRVQKDFQLRVRQLAEKQIRELIFIDKFSHEENLYATDQDVKSYLNLINRARTKEFVCFELPSFKIQGQEVPIPSSEIKRTCLREKSLNNILYYLTKK